MAHHFNVLILLSGALQGWLLSIWFFHNRKKAGSNVFAALLLSTVSLQLTSKIISKGWLMTNSTFFYFLSYQLPYLIGPLIYLFVRSIDKPRFSAKHLLHFLPFLCAAALKLGAVFVETFPFRPHPYADATLQLILMFVYTYFSFLHAPRAVRTFVKVVVAAETVIIITLSLMVVYYGRFPDVRLLFVALTLLVYWITWRVVARAEEFFPAKDALLTKSRTAPKYAHSSLKIEEADRIIKMLGDLMKNDKLYLDAGLTIDELSRRINTSRHHLSQVLNERLSRTYAEYIIDIRLEEACRRLRDYPHFTIAAVALDSGFSSVSAFNESFKKKFQTTPSRFREQTLNKMSA
ncbi:MAG TPA: helix-turn-helix domain-containing protein [Chryseosolibacter sp.]|nr:helix-turn-helix domain-containing protein [Chryseosolibacter sp.]